MRQSKCGRLTLAQRQIRPANLDCRQQSAVQARSGRGRFPICLPNNRFLSAESNRGQPGSVSHRAEFALADHITPPPSGFDRTAGEYPKIHTGHHLGFAQSPAIDRCDTARHPSHRVIRRENWCDQNFQGARRADWSDMRPGQYRCLIPKTSIRWKHRPMQNGWRAMAPIILR